MGRIGGIVEIPREGGGDSDSGSETGKDSGDERGTNQRQSTNPLNPDSSAAPVQGIPSSQDPEDRRENGSGGQGHGRRTDGRNSADPPPVQEDYRSQNFYECYHDVAEEYDKEFMKKHGEDLDTTLIFAGLFSAVASAFIISVQSELQPDTGEETVALLRVLIQKIDNTTFGNNAPPLPQWTGPSRAMVQVQAVLFASLAASLLSALLAMLGKQWLNQYAWTDMRGTAIERSQNRQRKMDGIDTWYFEYVMESLPLMLQVALLLLGCALSRYLWEINTIVASVVLGVTSFGVALYSLIIVAGATYESCPYQTPGAHILRWIVQHILPTSFVIFEHSWCGRLLVRLWSLFDPPWYSMSNILFLLILPPPHTRFSGGGCLSPCGDNPPFAAWLHRDGVRVGCGGVRMACRHP